MQTSCSLRETRIPGEPIKNEQWRSEAREDWGNILVTDEEQGEQEVGGGEGVEEGWELSYLRSQALPSFPSLAVSFLT